ncbi:MAG TPA: hypothetical protein VNA20_17060 [Frankiaceae bacterium]|nr:hypothetical protein [Frankiaceae bacterium]
MTVDPNRCPDCAEPLTAAPTCASCGLLLRGPLALRLWQVSNDLDRLERHRLQLIAQLRQAGAQAAAAPAAPAAPGAAPAAPGVPGVPAGPTPTATAVTAATAAAWTSGGPAAPAAPATGYQSAYATGTAADRPGAWRAPAPPRARKEWTPQRVQNLLLLTGAALLVVAAIAFTAFTWGRLPLPARGAIMLAVTAVTGWSARWVYRRGLTASAEAIALLTVVFAAIDAYAAWAANLAGLHDTDPATYWSVASGVLAAFSAGFARVLPVRSLRYAALVAAQLPLAITAVRLPGLTFAERGAFLVVQAGALGAAGYRLGETAVAARVSGAFNWALGAGLALTTAYGVSGKADVRLAAVVVVGAGAVALLWPGDRTRPAAVATAAVVLAAVAPARLTVLPVQIPAVIAAVGLLALVAAAAVDRAWRVGPALVGAGTVGVAFAAVSPWAAQVVTLPFTWLVRPWQFEADVAARAAIAEDGTVWGGTVVTLAVVAVSLVAAVVTAEVVRRWTSALWAIVPLAALTVLLVPLGFAWSFRAALSCYVAIGVAALAASWARRLVFLAYPASVVLAVATAWSLADRTTTLVVLAVVTVAYALYAAGYDVAREAASAAAAAGVCGYAAALAAARGAPPDRIGFVVATATFALMAASAVLGGRVLSLEVVAGAGYAVGLALSAGDPGWLAWTLAGGALVAGASAVRRRPLAPVAALLAAGCSAAAATAFGLEPAQAGFVVALTACAIVGAGAVLRYGDVSVVGAVAYAAGVVAAAPDVVSLSYALGAGALTAAAAAYRDRELAAASAALGIACAGTTSYALGAPLDQAGFVVALASAAALGAGWLLRGTAGETVEGVAAAGYVAALALSGTDPGWLSWVLLAGGLTALAAGLRPERRFANWVAVVLLTAWSWDRLWLENVEMPEAYAAPVAALLLWLGHARRRRDPGTGSWTAYGRGLGVAFAPTTYLVLTDPGVTRPVCLAIAGTVVLLAGVKERLQAPLTIGASALGVDALVQLAPVAVALPKWATIGALGLLVIAVGVTYEDRRRDVAKLREEFESLV